jgi:hypothetical protein
MNLQEMIRLSIQDSERWRGGLGHGEAQEAARPTTPASGNRRVDKAESVEWKKRSRITKPLCRVVGYIPYLQGKVVDWFPSRKRIVPHCG